ncbi:MAG: cobalt-precorrin hydrolase [Gammaproteobacteria bacterium]|jgi:cobalt-precorrin 5A hydrolase|nr:cobalt-precorrin hydrolase [Gammaproteobacteria bacterium]
MDLGETVIVAGVGCRKDISAAQVESAIEAALLHNRLAGHELGLIAVPAVKGTEAGIVAAAAARGVRLMLIAQKALEAADVRTLTRSARSMETMNVHSVAEAAALAAAGPNARLLAPRVAVGPVTCALAEGEISS